MADTLTTEPTEAVEPKDHAQGKADLGRKLKDKFSIYKKDRQPAETQWMKNLRQYLGKYDEDFEQKMAPNTSRAYPKITRVKCVSMVSRLMSLLFPAGEKNWSLEASTVPSLDADTLLKALELWRKENPGAVPTQAALDKLLYDTAKAAAEAQEKAIEDQLKDVDPYGACDYETLVRQVVHSAVLYGPGVVKGPMVVSDTMSRYEIDQAGMVQVVEVDAYRPYLEFVSIWDYFPDMSAKTFEQMDGEFQRHIYSRQQLIQLVERSDFDGDVIKRVVESKPDGDYERYNYETMIQQLGGQASEALNELRKYELLEYWGSMDDETLRKAGLELADDEKGDVRFTAWLLDGKVIKLAKNPFPFGVKVYHQFVFEEDEVNLLGSGLPPIMRDSQLAVSSFSRMLIDNASVVCGPNVEVDTDIISPSQTNHQIVPFKVWLKEGGSNGQRAVQSVSFDSHIPELLQAINRFTQFGDSETFVSPVTGGDVEGVPGEAMRTTGGASMIYANAALPFKDIVRNFDRFTVSVISALVNWNREFHVDSDKMQGDVRPVARGATSLMAKEVRAFALDNLANTLSEDERMYINPRAMLMERLKVRDLPLETLLATEDEVRQRQEQQAQAAQQATAQQAAMMEAQLKAMSADTMKALSQAQKNLDAADVAVFKALLEAVKNGASPEELAGIAARSRAGREGSQGAPVATIPRSVP